MNIKKKQYLDYNQGVLTKVGLTIEQYFVVSSHLLSFLQIYCIVVCLSYFLPSEPVFLLHTDSQNLGELGNLCGISPYNKTYFLVNEEIECYSPNKVVPLGLQEYFQVWFIL